MYVKFPDEFMNVGTRKLMIPQEHFFGQYLKVGTCIKGIVAGLINPEEFVSTGPFQIWSNSSDSWQMIDVNWHFDTLGFPDIPRVLQVDKLKFTEGSSSQIFTQATIEVVFKITQELRPHDVINIQFPPQFDISLVNHCESFRDKSYPKWKTNKMIGQYKQKESGNYKIDCNVQGQVVVIDGLWSLMDPRLDTDSDQSNSYIGFYISPVVNPKETFTAQSLLFTVDTRRLTYKNGPERILERSTTVELQSKLSTGEITDYSCTPSNYYKVFARKS